MNEDGTKTVRTPDGNNLILWQAYDNQHVCLHCGREIAKGEFYGVCADCGESICEDCCTKGGFENHNCDPDAWED